MRDKHVGGPGGTRNLKPLPLFGTRSEAGSALVLSLIALFVLCALGSIVASNLARSMYQTRSEINRVKGAAAAEAALNKGVFCAEARLADLYGNSWSQFVSAELYPNLETPATIQGTLEGVPYELWFEDNEDQDGVTQGGLPVIDQTRDSDDMIWVYARAFPPNGVPRTARGLIHSPPPPAALDFALFGNFVHFDNHNKQPFGVIMTTTVWSNSLVKVDSAIEIAGQITAVEEVMLNTGPRGNSTPYTVATPDPLQGDTGAVAPVRTAVPAPEVKAFPSFDFEAAKAVAIAHGTYFSGGGDFLAFLKADIRKQEITQTYGPPEDMRYIHVPHMTDLDQRFPLGDQNGNLLVDGSEHFKYKIYTLAAQNVNDFTYDNVYYVDGDLKLETKIDEMFRIEGSLIVRGKLEILCGGELLAYEERDSIDPATALVDIAPADGNRLSLLDGNGDGTNDTLVDMDGDGSVYDFRHSNPAGLGTRDQHYSDWPVIAAEDKLKIGGKDSGPIHIEGAIFTSEESHFHRSEANAKAFVIGNEIADTVHNCEFISFFYDKEVKNTKGFAERLDGRQNLVLLNFDEDPPVPSLPALQSVNVN